MKIKIRVERDNGDLVLGTELVLGQQWEWTAGLNSAILDGNKALIGLKVTQFIEERT